MDSFAQSYRRERTVGEELIGRQRTVHDWRINIDEVTLALHELHASPARDDLSGYIEMLEWVRADHDRRLHNQDPCPRAAYVLSDIEKERFARVRSGAIRQIALLYVQTNVIDSAPQPVDSEDRRLLDDTYTEFCQLESLESELPLPYLESIDNMIIALNFSADAP